MRVNPHQLNLIALIVLDASTPLALKLIVLK